MRFKRSFAAVSLVVALAAAFPAAVAAAPDVGWAWVVARHPTTASYEPAAKDRGNSAGMINHVYRASVGVYSIDMPGIDHGVGGDVQVSALNVAPTYCLSNSWSVGGSGPSSITVQVACFDFAGARVDSAFSATYMARGWNSGIIAYAWADMPTTTDYTPSPSYQYGSVTIHRSGVGAYLVRMPGADPDHGNVQVTGYIDGPCITGETSSDGTAMIVGVRCLNGDGRFDILYTKKVGLATVVVPKAAYVRVFPTRTGSSRTPIAYRYSSVNSAPAFTRTGPGAYTVTLTGMPKGGDAQVTAGGSTNHLCWLASIRTNATPQKVGVRCALVSGTADDSAFDLSYTK